MRWKNLIEMAAPETVVKYYGKKDWADNSLKYLLGLLSDNSTWSLPHNWHMKRTVAFLILERLKEAGFRWHYRTGSTHLHAWMKRKSWEGKV